MYYFGVLEVGKRVQGLGSKGKKVVISRYVIFDEKSMLQHTWEEEKLVPKNCSNNEHIVHVELETHLR